MALSAEQIATICDSLAEGMSLRAICRLMGLNECNVRRWIRDDSEAMTHYTRARELQADSYFDAVIDISNDTTMSADDRRIAIDARKWAAGKLHGKYSDKMRHVGGDEGDNPIRFDGFKRQFID